MLRVKLDENLGLAPKTFLKQRGYDVERVTEEGLSGQPDDVVWKHVCAEKRLFITHDLRFSDRRVYPPGSHPGIILLRLRARSRPLVVEALQRLLAECPLENLSGCLTIVDESTTRTRRA